VTFPPSFLFGAASAGEQVESGLSHNDWYGWANLPGKIQNGDKPDDGPDFFGHQAGDIQLMSDAHLGAYRFSIELSRLYPTKADFDADTPDPDGIAKYEALLSALQTAGIVPMVTLHHFAFPDWLSDVTMGGSPQGWELDETVQVHTEFAKRVATRWGKYIDWWITINEPGVETSVGYLASIWPPGAADAERMAAAMRQQITAHAQMFDAIHAADTVDADGDGKDAMVSMAFHNRVYLPKDAMSDNDIAATAHSYYFWNYWYLNAVVNGDFDWDFDENVDGPMDKKADPSLIGRLDYVGLNYYGNSLVSSKALKFPYMGYEPSESDLPTPAPKTAMGWDIYPQGFGLVIDQVAAYKLPIFVTENGVAQQATETTRDRFLAEHLFELGWAMQRGADIRGYAYWALTDNFEWASGFCPKFGLYSVDYSMTSKPRSPAEGRDILKSIIDARSIDQTSIDALPAYPQKPVKECSSI
jgi:beta-glucosidase